MTSSDQLLLQPHDLHALQRGQRRDHAPLVIDIRGARAYRKAHIPGSHPISVPSLLSGETLDVDLVLVGDRHHDTDSVAQHLYDAGFHRRIQQLAGGFPHWQEQGFEVESLEPLASSSSLAAPLSIVVSALVLLLLGWQQLSLSLVAIALLLGFAPGLFAVLADRAWQQSLRRTV